MDTAAGDEPDGAAGASRPAQKRRKTGSGRGRPGKVPNGVAAPAADREAVAGGQEPVSGEGREAGNGATEGEDAPARVTAAEQHNPNAAVEEATTLWVEKTLVPAISDQVIDSKEPPQDTFRTVLMFVVVWLPAKTCRVHGAC